VNPLCSSRIPASSFACRPSDTARASSTSPATAPTAGTRTLRNDGEDDPFRSDFCAAGTTSAASSIVGVPTGFADHDRLTGGLQKSDLIVLAARPGLGKSSLALSLAHNSAVRHQRSVAIFSLEMSKEQLAQRLLSMDAGIDQQRLRTGWIEDDEWDRIVIARDTLEEASIWIDDTASISTTELRSKARRLQAQEGIDLIIIDYLQLMQATIGGKRNENRVQEISEISRSLKALARELNVPVLALAQLSRAVESRQSKVPQLSDLRESGSIEQDADIVMFIYRDDVYNQDTEKKNIADIIVAKHRNGPLDEISLYFQASQTRFRDLEVNQAVEE
jgi:replicative DNA helicase